MITVIVATYNSAKTLRFTLQSIQAQDFENFEVQVVGDACTDESEAVVRSFSDPRFHWTNLSKNCGVQSGPNNKGLELAKGKYIAYLGHDDLWFPWHLSELVSSLEKNRADFVFSISALIGPHGVQNPIGPPPTNHRLETHFAPPSSWAHRKDLIATCGKWNCQVEKLSFPVDRDLWRRIFKRGKKIYFHPSLTVIKYPSPWWKTYARTENFPQEPFLEQLLKNPRALQTQILTDLVLRLSQEVCKKRVFRRWLERMIYAYGIDRFPFFYLKRWRFQRQRKKNLILRGLKKS